ncbi:MAG: glycoside hydrolase family 172 protein [Anaerolineae bacterium]
MTEFNGLGVHLGNIARVSSAAFRSISAENPTGAKGRGGMATEGTGAIAARELGLGWKVSPSIDIKGLSTVVLADIDGPGAIQHLWITVDPRYWRSLVLRFYWDNEAKPSVEVPLGDFFCNGWCVRCNVNSIPVAVNPAGGMNAYWEMPFRQHARITIENLLPDEIKHLFYQIDYTLTDVPEDYAYFHAQWRRSNPLPYRQVHTLLDGVRGRGQYIGTYIAWGAHNSGWWGEGEVKFYLDGDSDYPTYCGTGTEDYFGGAWAFENPYQAGEYGDYSTAFLGMPQVIEPVKFFKNQQRFGMYRWHIPDPIRFQTDLSVTIQALGWRKALEGKPRYLPLQDDIASTAFWYQLEPHVPFPTSLEADHLEVI